VIRLLLAALLCAAWLPAQEGRLSGVAREPNGGRLLPSVELTLVADEASSQVLSARTGADGRFSFEGLAFGTYTLSARKPGYEAGKPATRSVALTEAEPEAKADLILRKSAVLAGLVTDPDGQPMAEVAVELYRWQTIRGRRRLVTAGSSTTNDLGEFRMHGLAPERYLLRVNPLTLFGIQGVLAYEYEPAYYPGGTSPASAAAVPVGWGSEIVGLDIQVRYAPATAIEGQIFTAEGEPCAQCLVSAIGESNETAAAVTARADGSFALRGLAESNYRLVAMPRRRGGGNSVLEARLTKEEPLQVAMTLSPAREVSGRALLGPDAESREPMKFGVRLDAVAGAQFSRGRPAQSVASADGTFRITEVVPGEYDVSVSGLPDGVYLDSVRLAGRMLPGFTLNVPSDYDLTDVDLRLADDGAEVSGIVAAEGRAEGEPLAPPGVVALIPLDYGAGGRYELLASYRPADGQFLFKAVPPGDYTLIAVPTSNRFDLGEPADVELLRRSGERLKVRARASIESNAPFLPNPD